MAMYKTHNYNKGITVIVPAFNAEKTIKKCLDSIINQSYKDCKIIVIDDGSSDSTPHICDEYASKNDNISVFHIDNKGVSNARNVGIENVCTEYFVCVDSDDSVERDYLKCLYLAKKQFPQAGHYWCCFKTDKKGEQTEYLADKENEVSFFSKKQIMSLYEKWIAQAPYCKLYDTRIVHSCGLKMNTKYNLGEDLMFNLDYLDSVKNDKIVIINKATYNYILGNSNSLDSKYRENLDEIYDFLNNYILDYLRKWDANSDQLQIFYNVEFNSFENVLNNEMNEKNTISYSEKIRKNSERLASEKFRTILSNTNRYVNPFLLKAYKSNNYKNVILFNKLAKLKAKIRG